MRHSQSVIAAMLAMLGCGAGNAKSSVTIFGIVDVAVSHGRGSGPGSTSRTQLVSSGFNTSRLGLRGVEDLGGGMTAAFWFEGALTPDDGQGAASNSNNQASGAAAAPAGAQGLTFGRRSTVSLLGSWGEVRLGRNNAPHIENITLMDPFTNNGVGTAQTFSSAATIAGPTYVRASNSISYLTPGCSSTSGCKGFWAHGMYFLGENPSNSGATEKDGSGSSLRAGYGTDVLYVAAAVGRTRFAAGDILIRNVAVQYVLGRATLMGHLANDRVDSPVPVRGHGALVGIRYAIGSGEVRAAYSRYKLNTGTQPESSKLALGYVHYRSKRTALYGTAATIHNSGGAAQALGRSVTAPNASSRGFEVGIRHSF